MSNKKHKYTIILLPVLLVGMLAGYFFLGQHIFLQNHDIADLRAQIRFKQAKLDEVTTLRRELGKTEEQRNQLDAYFVTEEELPEFLNSFEAFGSITNSAITITEVSEEEGELIIALTAEGKFPALYDFLLLVENMPYRLIIERFFLQRDATKSTQTDDSARIVTDEWKLSLLIHLSSYIEDQQSL